ncbi:thioredoxin 1-like [Zingiber officinale]|uniref:Thioredoxin domain-containing protein n=1 Tax=Zingiber officinale TaxID=94328 RepID=A0A8J5G5B0_ZINOF|nr:thioredoxin 1-like [Zingiber officinale]KAG6491875.1 hypothetical protein ZIOFF_046815 [Zingiber officinale]
MLSTVVDSTAVPRLPVPTARAVVISPTSSFMGPRSTRPLSHFSGLRMSAPLAMVLPPKFRKERSRDSRLVIVVCEASEATAELPVVTNSTWHSLVLESDIPVLVDFWAPWYEPCQTIEPLIVKLAKEYEGKLKCYKMNTDENPDITTQYGIRSIPTMLLFKDGEKKNAVIGAVPETTLVSLTEKFINS